MKSLLHLGCRALPIFVRYWIGILLFFVILGFFNRLVLAVFVAAGEGSPTAPQLFGSFLVGLRFDVVIFGYFALAPLLIAGLLWIVTGRMHFRRGLFVWFLFSAILTSIANFVDLFYWPYFEMRLGVAALQWFDTPALSLKMVWETYPVLRVAFAFVVFLILLTWGLCNFHRPKSFQAEPRPLALRALVFLSVAALTFVAARGEVKIISPIRPGASFFSTNDYANRLAQNSLFMFLNSVYESRRRKSKTLLSPDEYVQLRQQFDSIYPGFGQTKSVASPTPTRLNFVVVLMESFAAAYVAGFHQGLAPENLTPNFQRWIPKGHLFTRFFSNGAHTGHGIFSTTSGRPNTVGPSLTKSQLGMRSLNSYPAQLSARGYRTLFLVNGDPDFDNRYGFVKANGYQEAITEKDYGVKSLSALGVGDHVVFDRALQEMRAADAAEKPMLTMILTSSHHGPWAVPEGFPFAPFEDASDPRARKYTSLRYADYSVGRFLDEISSEKFFSRTVVFLLGDHGVPLGSEENDLKISRFHVPLLIVDGTRKFFAPGLKSFGSASQMDLAPTIMDLAGGAFENPFAGSSLLAASQKNRPVPVAFQQSFGMFFGNEFYYPSGRGGLQAMNWESGERLESPTFSVSDAAQWSRFMLSWMQHEPRATTKNRLEK